MNPKIWGKVFRNLRETKNLSLAKVAGDYPNSPEYVISKQQVSRFELGQSDITLTKISGLLDNMGVSFEEYLYHVRNYELPRHAAFFDRLGVLQELKRFAEIEQNYLLLLEKYDKTKRKSFYWQALEYKAFLAQKHCKAYEITDTEIQEVSDYLFSVLEWGEEELFLFDELFSFLARDLISEFAKDLLSRTVFYRKLPSNKQHVIIIIRNCTLYFIDKGLQTQAQILLKSYKDLITRPIVDVYNRKEYLLVEGKYFFLIGEKEKGIKIFENLARMYDLLDYPETAQHMRDLLEKELRDRHK